MPLDGCYIVVRGVNAQPCLDPVREGRPCESASIGQLSIPGHFGYHTKYADIARHRVLDVFPRCRRHATFHKGGFKYESTCW